MKKIMQNHRNCIIVIIIFSILLCAVGISLSGDSGDIKVLEHEEIPDISEERYEWKNPYFYVLDEKKMERVQYEGYFYLHTYNDIWQNVSLDIAELKTFENGILYTLELEEELDVDDPFDQLGWGRKYIGYFYVTDDAVYYRSTATMDGYTDKEKQKIIDMIKRDEKEFCEKESCIVCCEKGTADVTDEQGFHAFVEAKGDRRIFRYYSNHYLGSKDYILMVWEKGKGLVYYIYGNGNKNLHVEFGENIKEKQEESYGNPYDMHKGPKKEPFYGTWYIEKAATKSEMYTGTTLDGVAEEDLYDSEDFLGYELEYTSEYFRIGDKKYKNPKYTEEYVEIEEVQDGGKFWPKLFMVAEDEGIKVNNEEDYRGNAQVLRFDVDFSDEVSYGKYDFIPVGTQCTLLNEDTMLVGIWGKILLARRIYEELGETAEDIGKSEDAEKGNNVVDAGEDAAETENRIVKPETDEAENARKISGETFSRVMDCLDGQVPELDSWADYVEEKSKGKAYLYSRSDDRLEDVYRNGEGSEYLGKYYSVYVGEMWEDHSVNWEWFYVSEDFDEVLWEDIVMPEGSEFEVYTLEEWRNLPNYRGWMR